MSDQIITYNNLLATVRAAISETNQKRITELLIEMQNLKNQIDFLNTRNAQLAQVNESLFIENEENKSIIKKLQKTIEELEYPVYAEN